MKQIVKYSLVAISAVFVAVGCGGSGDSSGDGNSTSHSEPASPADTELVYLKVEGMS